MSYKAYPLLISESFLHKLNKLSKMSIKVYLSLSYLQKKRGGYFEASHNEISSNDFNDFNYRDGSFDIRSDEGQYYKAFKQLEALGLIKVHRSKTQNSGNNINRYNVY